MNKHERAFGARQEEKIVILDAGGQYCHLIARKVRELGIYAEIEPCDVSPEKLTDYKGIIISGGPASVYSHDRPIVDKAIFELGIPTLGICYGHQIMTEMLGGKVERGTRGEYGVARLSVSTEDSIFQGITKPQQVWMSHRDVVAKEPLGFEVLGTTPDCKIAAMANFAKKQFGLQFHPEVMHTENGRQMLDNFVYKICECKKGQWIPADRLQEFHANIRKTVGTRNVFFLISGGVDSTVAFALCVDALGKDRVRGLYVDTGFMRQYDSEAIDSLVAAGMDNINVIDASDKFMDMLKGLVTPETKRKSIGKKFLEITEQVMNRDMKLNRDDWVLGQGTIYPDTIESGGTKNSAHIKTHHNRVSIIRKLIEEGKVVEPLSELYKDEVRDIGHLIAKRLRIPTHLIDRHPFPGPGLAIRCLVSKAKLPLESTEDDKQQASAVRDSIKQHNLSALTLPLRTVGVKGDERSYDSIVVLAGRIPSKGKEKVGDLAKISTSITNADLNVNRVTYALTESVLQAADWQIKRAFITRKRVDLLRAADNFVFRFMNDRKILGKVWQFPVVLVPLSRKSKGGETIVLRPVDSIDGMTAQFSRLEVSLLRELASSMMEKIAGIDAVLLDVTNKPPATIEWE